MIVRDEVGLDGGKRIHLIGIGGAGMSAIARVLLGRGHPVSGSDLRDSSALHDLAGLGARISLGHCPENVHGAEVVVATSAAPADNPELAEARRLGLPIWHRGEMLRRLTAGQRCIAVAGTHGKTTTTALLALLLRTAGRDPSFVVGGEVPELGCSGHAGSGPHFVLEADEYDRTFLSLRPAVAVVTNVEWDHVDCYPSADAFREAFAQFVALVPAEGALFLCRDDAGAWGLPRPAAPAFGYGLAPDAAWQAVDLDLQEEGTAFTLRRAGRPAGRFRLCIPGEHNVRNALAALAVASWEGVDLRQAEPLLAAFGGVERRFQVLGSARGVAVVDDYAHHPSEIRATLAAARQRYPGRRLVAAFQPHTYSRTRAFGGEMAQALSLADLVLVTGVYAARESDPGDVSAQEVAMQVSGPAAHVPTLEEALSWLRGHLQSGDVLLTLGAGDITRLGRQLLARLEGRTWGNGPALDALLARWPGQAFRNAPLSAYTTFRLGGPADLLIVARSLEELQEAVYLAEESRLPWIVLGRGSNVLAADVGFRGVVIVNRAGGVRWELSGRTATLVVASGESLAGLVRQTARQGWAGLEWAAGIPGTVGGAVVGNAGAFGGCMASLVSWVDVCGGDGQVRRLETKELDFAYRHSRFRGRSCRETILEVGLLLHRGIADELQRACAEHLRWRREHQPRGPSAGSVFRNPPGRAAGRLLDQAGMKGRACGAAWVSPLHANFILNRGGARAAEVRALIEEARQAVRRAAGLELQLEIELVGDWADTGSDLPGFPCGSDPSGLP